MTLSSGTAEPTPPLRAISSLPVRADCHPIVNNTAIVATEAAVTMPTAAQVLIVSEDANRKYVMSLQVYSRIPASFRISDYLDNPIKTEHSNQQCIDLDRVAVKSSTETKTMKERLDKIRSNYLVAFFISKGSRMQSMFPVDERANIIELFWFSPLHLFTKSNSKQ